MISIPARRRLSPKSEALDPQILDAAAQLTAAGRELTARRICELLEWSTEVPQLRRVQDAISRMRNQCRWPYHRHRGRVYHSTEVQAIIARQPREEFLHRPKIDHEWLPPISREHPLETPRRMARFLIGKRWEQDNDE